MDSYAAYLLLNIISFFWIFSFTFYTLREKENSVLTVSMRALILGILLLQLHALMSAYKIIEFNEIIHNLISMNIAASLLVMNIYFLRTGFEKILVLLKFLFVLILAYVFIKSLGLTRNLLYPVSLFTILITSTYLFFSRKNELDSYKVFFKSVIQGTFILTLAYLFEKSLFIKRSDYSAIFTLLCVWAHYIFCNAFNAHFSIKRRKETIKLIINYVLFLIILFVTVIGLFFISYLLGSKEYLSVEKIGYPVVISLFIYVLVRFVEVAFRRIEKIFHNDYNDYKKRITHCKTYMKSLLNFNQFIQFLSGILYEFFGATDLYFIIVENQNEVIRVINKGFDKKFILKKESMMLCEIFNKYHYFQFNDIEGDKGHKELYPILNFLVHDNKLNTGFKVRETHNLLCLCVFYTQGRIRNNILNKIYLSSRIIGECISNILIFEKIKNVQIQKMSEQNDKLDITGLENEKKELQKSYDKIRTIQKEIIEKEKKAALTKFCISLDDEISSPLNNLLMAIQYQVEKIEKKPSLNETERDKILLIIQSQCIRIKNILDEFRRITDSYTAKDGLLK
ncbi:MAG: hypothetical protein ACD_79C00362G0002 [uncultured bacterium]|nr:MAG: hypothetical protein ACD_79C00362G0002 [uncultured bacterium]